MSVSVAALALARVLPRAFAAILVLLLSVVALLGRRASALLLIRELRIIALALGIELLSGGARAHRLLRVVRQERISNSRDFERILLIILKERSRHGLDPRDGKQDHRLKEVGNGNILVLQTRELLDDDVQLRIWVLTLVELGVQSSLQVPEDVGELSFAVLLVQVRPELLSSLHVLLGDIVYDPLVAAHDDSAARFAVIDVELLPLLLVRHRRCASGRGHDWTRLILGQNIVNALEREVGLHLLGIELEVLAVEVGHEVGEGVRHGDLVEIVSIDSHSIMKAAKGLRR